MAFNLHGKSLLTIRDWTTEEVKHVLLLSQTLKQQRYSGVSQNIEGNKKNIVVIMQKDSTRTRSAFEVAAFDLGMNVTYIGGTGSQIGKKESIEDTAKVLGGFYDGIAFRGADHKDVETLAENAGVPVWNALTDDFHPTQMFADYLTILEEFGRTDIKFAFFGDAKNNMGNSLMLMAAHMGAHFVGVAPKEFWPDEKLIKDAKAIAKKTGAKIEFSDDPIKGAKDADVVYTDVWVSMGEPDSVWKDRIKKLSKYTVDEKVMAVTSPKSIFMHCLPAFHDTNTIIGKEISKKFGIDHMEVTDKVFRSNKSRVFKEAENRMHSIKAIIVATLGY